MQTAAFIPARGGSKGLPGKNIRKFMGEPLIGRAIKQARSAGIFDSVFVNTDCFEIAGVAESYGATVLIRPEEMGSDIAEVDPLMVWTLEELSRKNIDLPEVLSLLYCTAPLRTPDDIVSTVKKVTDEGFDSALTLVEDHSYLWKIDPDMGVATPTNYEPSKRASRQTENWNQYIENKAVYAFKVKDILDHGCRLSGNIGFHLMPALRSIDIDSIEDFTLAENIALSGV